MGKTVLAVLICLQLATAGAVLAGPERPLSDIYGSILPHGQWFVPASSPQSAPHSASHQFYDNPTWSGDDGPGFGGWAGSAAISGLVTHYVVISGNLTEFTVRATITDDNYEYSGTLAGTAATYGTFTAGNILGQAQEPMFNVHLCVDFAGKDVNAGSNIYASDYDELAFYGISTSEPPTADANGSFSVPTWTFGDIGPDGSASRTMTFKLKTPVDSEDPLYEWVVESYDYHIDIFASRTRTVKIPMFPAGPVYDEGNAWPDFEGSYSCNASVFYDEKPSLAMRTGNNTANGHYWWKGMSMAATEMMQFRTFAGRTGKVDVLGVTLKASGAGNDQNDISAVSVYLDEDESGGVDEGELLCGGGTYNADDGTCAITFTKPYTVPSPSPWGVYFVVTYTLRNGVTPNKTYKFDLVAVDAVQTGTSTPVATFGMPVTSATEEVISAPRTLTIGQAKKLPLGSLFMLKDEPVIGEVGGSVFIEETDCTSGIALAPSTEAWKHIWVPRESFVTLVGRIGVQDGNGLAVVKNPMILESVGFAMPEALLMTCRTLGGGALGAQRGTLERVASESKPEKPSTGLNNVGMLATVCGRVKYITSDAFWLYDGSDIWDGRLDDNGDPVQGVKVLLPEDVVVDPSLAPSLGDCVRVTGIVTTQAYTGSIDPIPPLIKVLGPRHADDIVVVLNAGASQ